MISDYWHNVTIGVAGIKRWEEERDQVNVYFEELSTMRQCVGFLIVQETLVENPLPAIIRVYDYYQQELSVSTVSSCSRSVLTLYTRRIWEVMPEFMSHVHAWTRYLSHVHAWTRYLSHAHAWTRYLPIKFRIVLHLVCLLLIVIMTWCIFRQHADICLTAHVCALWKMGNVDLE